jgi:twinkle protein
VATVDPLDDVLSRLSNVRKCDGYWIASSPTRRDSNPSLSIRQGEKGVLIKDFGGSTVAEVVDAIGMEMADLFYDDPEAKRAWLAENIVRPRKTKTYRKPELPEELTFREGSIRWFAGRGITEETMKAFSVYSEQERTFEKVGKTPAICFPYFRAGVGVNIKYRSVKAKKFQMVSGAEPIWYNLDGVEAKPQRVVIVEGEMDVLSLHQGGIANVISPPNGCESIGDEVMESGAWFLKDDSVRIILAGDMDSAGQKMMDALAARIGKERCSKVSWPDGCKDANETLIAHGIERVVECVDEAEPIPVDGLIRISSVKDAVLSLYDEGLPPGYSTGIPSLDEHYTIKPGYWCAVTGSPGSGKSNILDQIMTNMAERDGHRFGVASFENRHLARHAANILPKHFRQPFGEGRANRMTREQVAEGTAWMDNYFFFNQPESPTIEAVLKVARSMVFSYGITGLVIDPWNRLMHPANGLTDGGYIARCLSMISDFAYRHSVYIWLVAHPTKLTKNVTTEQYPCPTLYDISGSAHFYNMCDFGWAGWRDRKELHKPIEFHMQKSRHQEIASEGCVRIGYDHITTRYYDLAADGSNDNEMWRPPNLVDLSRRSEPQFMVDESDDVREMEEADSDAAGTGFFDQVVGQ